VRAVCCAAHAAGVRWITAILHRAALFKDEKPARLDYPLFFQAVQSVRRRNLKMDTFNWLFVGHLIADWMLQTDWIARNKQRSWFNYAVLVHCTVYTVVLVGTLWLSRRGDARLTPYAAFTAIIFLSHWIIDAGNLARGWMRTLRQSPLPFVRLMVDQTMHVVVLVVLVEWLLA
jgi:hypothetical protein